LNINKRFLRPNNHTRSSHYKKKVLRSKRGRTTPTVKGVGRRKVGIGVKNSVPQGIPSRKGNVLPPTWPCDDRLRRQYSSMELVEPPHLIRCIYTSTVKQLVEHITQEHFSVLATDERFSPIDYVIPQRSENDVLHSYYRIVKPYNGSAACVVGNLYLPDTYLRTKDGLKACLEHMIKGCPPDRFVELQENEDRTRDKGNMPNQHYCYQVKSESLKDSSLLGFVLGRHPFQERFNRAVPNAVPPTEAWYG
jgi:hypothetical protein